MVQTILCFLVVCWSGGQAHPALRVRLNLFDLTDPAKTLVEWSHTKTVRPLEAFLSLIKTVQPLHGLTCQLQWIITTRGVLQNGLLYQLLVVSGLCAIAGRQPRCLFSALQKLPYNYYLGFTYLVVGYQLSTETYKGRAQECLSEIS